VTAPELQPPEVRLAMRPGRGTVALHATGFRHPRSRWSPAEDFTAYADLTHLQLGRRQLRIGTRRGVFALERADFADPQAPETLVRALLERVASGPEGAAQLAAMADAEELLRQPLPLRVTPIAAGLCLAVFALQIWLGPEVEHAGLMSPFLAGAGEPWRLVTANFLHGGPVHLLFGALGLLALGALVERPLGAVRTLLVLGLSGLAATAVAWPAGYERLLGASGMVAGLAGAMLWLELRCNARLPAAWRLPRRPFVGALLLDAALPLAVPVIAGAAHVAGFVAGAAAAAVATGPRLRREPLRPPVALASLLVLVAGVASFASAGRFLVGSSAWEIHARRLLADRGTPPVLMNDAAWLIAISPAPSAAALDEALELAERAVHATRRHDPNLLDTLAEAQFRAGDADAALATIDEAIALRPDQPYFREQRRRFLGDREPGDRPAPPGELRPAPRAPAEPLFDARQPGISI